MQISDDIRVLVVDDEPAEANYVAEIVRRQGYPADVAHSVSEAANLLKKHQYTLALCDLRLGPEEGTALLPHIKKDQEHCQTVFVTGFGSMDSAVRAIHDGAFDYISKPLDLAEIEPDVKSMILRAIKHRAAMERREPEPARHVDIAVGERIMVGRSQPMIAVYRAIARAAMSTENVLITGESGTGKELVARAIHEKGGSATKPFVTVNCCALSENLLESELFGHVRGAFTGAIQGKRGLFEEADGGTLFLDEIGDISQALQVKLLRAIQEGEIKPVGSNETRKVNVRVLAATHRDLPAFVQEGKFREDLFYRLKVISVEMPPLRDRMRDLPDLVNYFMTRYAQKSGKPMPSVAPETLEVLMHYPWPGNIRELENAMSRAIAMTMSPILFPEDFPPEILKIGEETLAAHAPEVDAIIARALPTPVFHAGLVPGAPIESLEDVEKRHIAQTLESVGFNKSKAAGILGIDRVTLYRKASKYGLFGKDRKTASEQPS